MSHVKQGGRAGRAWRAVGCILLKPWPRSTHASRHPRHANLGINVLALPCFDMLLASITVDDDRPMGGRIDELDGKATEVHPDTSSPILTRCNGLGRLVWLGGIGTTVCSVNGCP